MATIRECLLMAIEARGGKLIEKGRKRWVTTHPRTPGQRYFLGVAGGLRVGATFTASIGLDGMHVRDMLLQEGMDLVAAQVEQQKRQQRAQRAAGQVVRRVA